MDVFRLNEIHGVNSETFEERELYEEATAVDQADGCQTPTKQSTGLLRALGLLVAFSISHVTRLTVRGSVGDKIH